MWFFRSPVIVFGEGALCHLAETQGSKALIVTDGNIAALGFVEKVQEQLSQAGIETAIFAEVEPNPSLQTVKRGAQAASPICLQPIGPWSPDASPPAEVAMEGEIMVAFRTEGQADRLFNRLDGAAEGEYLPSLGIWRLQVQPGQEEAILAQLRADPTVAYADRVHPVFAQ